jgi:tetratricopeptide (TPR) repeat protein
LGSTLAIALVVCLRCAAAHADSGTARAFVEDGDLHASAGDKDGALARYVKAIDADADMLGAYEKAIPLWLEVKRWDQGERYLERVTARHPDFAAAWYALGYIYRQERRWDAAIAAYQESTALQAGDAAPWFGLAASYEGDGRAADAVRAYRRYRALERDPARAAFRADARTAIAQLLGPPADWRDAAIRLALDGADRASLATAAKLAR